MTRMLLSLATITLLATGVAYGAGDSAAGKAKAAACVACHGANGQGGPPTAASGGKPIPTMAGKSEDELVQAMLDYKSGKRANPVMKALMTPLTDQDMANLAAYYASLK